MITPISDRIVYMSLWTLGDDGRVDCEMLDVLLHEEGFVLREGQRDDLIALLHHWHRKYGTKPDGHD